MMRIGRMLAVMIGLTHGAMAAISPEYDPNVAKVMPKMTLRARPFSLSDVRLLDGPFKHAMTMDAKYLLELEPDRLLHSFRVTAGLEPKAPVYGAWESQGVAGHTLGHYLSAISMIYASTGDKRFLDRVNYIVGELALCQSKRADGYVSAIPDGDRVFKEVSEGDIRSQGFDLNGIWVPWYTLHKLFAGLIDAYLYCGSADALKVAEKLADWAIAVTKNLNEEQWQRMLACEHGGMNEAMANLYALTGEKKYLDLALKFHHKAVLDPLEHREDRLAGLHGNTQIPKIIGTAREYELTGENRFETISEFFWESVVRHHTYVIGGHGSAEHFGPPDQLSDWLTTSTAESCNTYNMLKLTKHLFSWNPSAAYADYYERALYNHILASQDPKTGMMCYYISLVPGGFKAYSEPFDSFWCCVGTGIENHARYGESIYFFDDEGLWVNLYIPSELHWKEKGVTLRQETKFPDDDNIRFRVSCEKPVEFTLRLRYPSWATRGMTVHVNGKAVKVEGKPGSYVNLHRTWADGDAVEMTLPMSLHVEPMPDNPKRVAFLDGPIVLAGDLGSEAQEIKRIPVFVSEGKPYSEWIRPVAGQPETFQTEKTGRPFDVKLEPFYKVSHRRYSVYWDLFAEEEWKRKEEEYRAEEERRKALQERTVDFLQIGEMQPERDHDLKSEKSGMGDFNGKKWRDASDGGWFSFQMKVSPDEPTDLILTYWGSDGGGREFDILANGEKIGEQVLTSEKPGQFFDVVTPLPEALTKGKASVTIRLQAHPGKMAGGLFGCRSVRRAPAP